MHDILYGALFLYQIFLCHISVLQMYLVYQEIWGLKCSLRPYSLSNVLAARVRFEALQVWNSGMITSIILYDSLYVIGNALYGFQSGFWSINIITASISYLFTHKIYYTPVKSGVIFF